jgi:RES domain-containing protein
MFDEDKYEYDQKNKSQKAKLHENAVLYRLTSFTHSNKEEVLTGKGALRDSGRFHVTHQRTSYCANNMLVCLSEVLFHNYQGVLSRMNDNQPWQEVNELIEDERCLVMFKVGEIDKFVFIDSDAVRVDLNKRMSGTMVVFPQANYLPFQQFSTSLRGIGMNGVFYPSARHSKDICIALFEDHSKKVKKSDYRTLAVTLNLLKENQNFNSPIEICDPFSDKIHPTMGYYRFDNEMAFIKAKSDNYLNPPNIPIEGKIDFVRRLYLNYPVDAVLA